MVKSNGEDMEKTFLKTILGAFIACSFALSLGSFASNKVALSTFPTESSAISYSLDDEEEVSSSTTTTDEEEPVAVATETSTSVSEESSQKTEDDSTEVEETIIKTTVEGGPTFKEILEVFKNTFKDAWQDLVAHIKRWLRLS